jgi:hypothetical protein
VSNLFHYSSKGIRENLIRRRVNIFSERFTTPLTFPEKGVHQINQSGDCKSFSPLIFFVLEIIEIFFDLFDHSCI